MGTALVSLGLVLALAWGETFYQRDHFSRRRARTGWLRTELHWRLPILLVITAAFTWGAWQFFSR